MKKILTAALMAVIATFTMIGCDIPPFEDSEDDRVCVVYYDGVCMAYTTIPETTPAEDGLSAYELALEQGYDGTLDEWLASLVGADGICPDCTEDDNETDPVDDNVTEPEVIPDGMILMTFENTEGFANAQLAHTVDGYLISVEDVEVVDLNGSFLVEGNITVEGDGMHGIGLIFDNAGLDP